MRNQLLLLLIMLSSTTVSAQFVYKIKADSLLVTNDSCTAEFILENSTKNVKGFLVNKGNGRTEFRKATKLTDTSFIIAGDTIVLRGDQTSGWAIKGNTGIINSTDFLGTNDTASLIFKTNNVERARFTGGTGRVGFGTNNPEYKWHFSDGAAAGTLGIYPFSISGNGATGGMSILVSAPLEGDRPVFLGVRTRGTGAAPEIVQTDDYLTGVVAGGYDGVKRTTPASMEFQVDSTPSLNNIPARVAFYTGTWGGNRRVRFVISRWGKIGIGINTQPSAWLHINTAGSAPPGSAPIKLTAGTNLTTPEAGAIEFDGTNYFATTGTTRYTICKALTATATLDFPSTNAQTESDLTITVTGANVGDPVSLGVPNGSTLTGSSYSAWVSATNTVTVRFAVHGTSAKDPASGDFKVSVISF